MYEVGAVIREARNRRGWGQRRLAEVSGVSQPNLAAIESGTRVPSLAMVARLVRACGLQLRFELEARHADVDTEVAARLDRPPTARLATAGVEALTSAARMAMAGLRLVVDGPLAARLWGAPVPDAAERIWCDHADLGRLREAAVRCHYQPVPVRPRYADDGGAGLRTALADGDQLRVGAAVITLGVLPPAPWTVSHFGEPLPVVDLATLQDDWPWASADRVALQQLAERLAEAGEASAGLDKAG